MWRDLAVILRTVVCCLVYLTMAAPAGALQLVTAQEAALPPDEKPDLTFRGSPTRGPGILVVAPAENAGYVKSPLIFKIRFVAFGGARINADSITVTYMKTPAVNLTQRLMPFIRVDGIDLPNAEVPPGTHQIRIELKYTDGRAAGKIFAIQVAD